MDQQLRRYHLDVYNILTIEITAEDLRAAATNSGKMIPLAPNTRSVNIKGIVQTLKEPTKSEKEPEKVTKPEDTVPPLGGLPVAG
jgi:hypothetical protein